ncbi:hypothetical protein J0910_14220 [Nocardiopsis sp. CNT-189]
MGDGKHGKPGSEDQGRGGSTHTDGKEGQGHGGGERVEPSQDGQEGK